MHVYHLTELKEISPPALTQLYYGRYLATVQPDGTVMCDNHQYAIDGCEPPEPGDRVMIWCSHDYYCCPTQEFEELKRH
ncbi:hypothetical protein GMLC_07570 [Geomonas limicola]|uniref:Uncharacterized protein n=1 Tax=Geomonas limicola TaxID=2740186 RepID=A0A6V8N3Q8_9BACT|nr:hypothetical protein [Geomonas limicola]GFO67178.1 hypothetical protein GMLC_07570 [Geomonas limicola]